jgi:hypothetical protein
LVDTNLLIHKLDLIGFEKTATDLIKNYFSNRQQLVKLNDTKSDFSSLDLGVPQGSVLGPLFFTIFINDLPYALKKFKSLLFADDTTLYDSDTNINILIDRFKLSLKELTEWCKCNRLDINWSKTFFMIVTNKRILRPSEILFNDSKIKVVDSFKLLGIIIDNKLNFLENSIYIRKEINKRMYSIKRLFYLPFSVKLQFFKSFIMPYFDYCLSLYIYYPKTTIQKMCNCYYFCIYKLFKLKLNNNNINDSNNILEHINLSTLQHHLIIKLFIFIFKIINKTNSPQNLKNQIQNDNIISYYTFREKKIINRTILSNTHYGESTFEYFFVKFINSFLEADDLNLNFLFFKKRIFNNINLIYSKFITIFPKFDLNIKNYFY